MCWTPGECLLADVLGPLKNYREGDCLRGLRSAFLVSENAGRHGEDCMCACVSSEVHMWQCIPGTQSILEACCSTCLFTSEDVTAASWKNGIQFLDGRPQPWGQCRRMCLVFSFLCPVWDFRQICAFLWSQKLLSSQVRVTDRNIPLVLCPSGFLPGGSVFNLISFCSFGLGALFSPLGLCFSG